MNSIKTALLKIENVIVVTIDKEADIITINTTRVILANILANLVYPEKGHNTLLHKGKSFVICV